MRFHLKKILILVIYIVNIKSDCNVCQTNNHACHSENTHSLCINGIPEEDYVLCPENYVCTTDRLICKPLPDATPSCSTQILPDPNLCGVCSENKVFACLNETTIVFCFGEEFPYEDTVSPCPENTVCDLNNTEFCSDAALVKPSCVKPGGENPEITTVSTTTNESSATEEITISTEPTETTTQQTTTTIEPITTTTTLEPITTTSSTPRDPNAICQDAASAGSHQSDDPTCKTYVMCYTLDGGVTFSGRLLDCGADKYYDPPSKLCTTNVPEGCTQVTTTTIGETTTIEITTFTEPTTTTQQTTTTIEPITTTSSTPRDPNAICQDAASKGSHKSDDPTCKTYVMCYTLDGGVTFSGRPVDCGSDKYFDPSTKLCTTNVPAGCIQQTTTTIEQPTESTTEPTTTTTAAPRDPNVICKDKTTTGSYKSDDPTCKTFVQCYTTSSNTLAGYSVTCKSEEYFDPVAKGCTANKPDGCL